MTQSNNKVRLKGGSLSGTYLINSSTESAFVRKEVSLSKNREYGFQRWYSQLKRMQRYSYIFPGVFPELLDYGMNKEEDIAYFDMEYIEDSLTVQEYLLKTDNNESIEKMFSELVNVMSRMHSVAIPSTSNPMELYVREEIEQKIDACYMNTEFVNFIKYESIVFNGEKIPSFMSILDEYKQLARDSYRYTTETFTHGNLTLENILYQPKTGRIIFIDPYEENIIDSELAEYSQIYQSSNSKYELYNEKEAEIYENRVDLLLPEYKGLNYFNEIFTSYIESKHNKHDMICIKLLEISQFARMLPFKMEIDPKKMIFFYSLASYLFNKLKISG